MQRLKSTRGLAAVIIATVGLVVAVAGTSGARNTVGPTKGTFTFSFQAGPNSKTSQLFSIRGLSVNARCTAQGAPVIFAFSSSNHADLLGHMIDGSGRVHVIKNDGFTKSSKGVSLAPATSGDRDASGTVVYGDSGFNVVTVNYAFDNSRTLANLNVCTVYGTVIAN